VNNQGDIAPDGSQPVTIPRPDHEISRASISSAALKVLYGLKEAGYQSFLVGGGVRDLLLGREPKDFDVGTDATPEEIRNLFRSCRLIGRRFRLAHVRFGREVIEVATFRARHDEQSGEGSDSAHSEEGRILRDNVFGSLEEDAWRRDFTVNALYYDIKNFSVVDYVGGLDDLKAGTLKLIGDPEQRYREDPVRMLRAVRFAAKLGFRIHPDTEEPMHDLGQLLEDIPSARLFEEVLKLFLGGCALTTFELLRHYDLFRYLFPMTDEALSHEEEGFPITFVARALENTDNRLAENKPVTPAFLYAALLWEPVRLRTQELIEQGAVFLATAFCRADGSQRD
jgi:poly(A) polymerase